MRAALLFSAFALITFGAYTRCRSALPSVFATLLAFALEFRDLTSGAFVSGGDPLVSLALGAALFVALLPDRGAKGVLLCFGVLCIWPFLDPAWFPAFLLAFVTAIGAMFDRKGKPTLELAATLAAIILTCFRPETLAELRSTIAALGSASDSSLRSFTGWLSPNFQIRRELVFGVALAIWTNGRRSWRETFLICGSIIVALTGEIGAPFLALACVASAAARAEIRTAGSPFWKNTNIQSSAVSFVAILIALALPASRPELRNYERASVELIPAIKAYLNEVGAEKRSVTILSDFRGSAALIKAGIPPWIDLRLLADANTGASAEKIAQYESLTKVSDDFETLLQQDGIDGIVFNDEAPIANVLREHGWTQRAKSAPYDFLFRGTKREESMVFLLRPLGEPKN